MNLEEMRNDRDWIEAFGFATNIAKIVDVKRIVASADGENDGEPWVGVFELNSGEFLYLTAGCDYTGWDCRGSGEAETRPTLAAIIIECLTEDDRGLPLHIAGESK